LFTLQITILVDFKCESDLLSACQLSVVHFTRCRVIEKLSPVQ